MCFSICLNHKVKTKKYKSYDQINMDKNKASIRLFYSLEKTRGNKRNRIQLLISNVYKYPNNRHEGL